MSWSPWLGRREERRTVRNQASGDGRAAGGADDLVVEGDGGDLATVVAFDGGDHCSNRPTTTAPEVCGRASTVEQDEDNAKAKGGATMTISRSCPGMRWPRPGESQRPRRNNHLDGICVQPHHPCWVSVISPGCQSIHIFHQPALAGKSSTD